MQTRRRSALGCGLASITRATRKPRYLALGSSTPSTSRPMRVSASTISASEAVVSRWSLSQERVSFIGLLAGKEDQQTGARPVPRKGEAFARFLAEPDGKADHYFKGPNAPSTRQRRSRGEVSS